MSIKKNYFFLNKRLTNQNHFGILSVEGRDKLTVRIKDAGRYEVMALATPMVSTGDVGSTPATAPPLIGLKLTERRK